MGHADDHIIYYKDYEANVIRGAIVAGCFATIFIFISIVRKYRWKEDEREFNEYSFDCSIKSTEDLMQMKNNEEKELESDKSASSGIRNENSALELDED